MQEGLKAQVLLKKKPPIIEIGKIKVSLPDMVSGSTVQMTGKQSEDQEEKTRF